MRIRLRSLKKSPLLTVAPSRRRLERGGGPVEAGAADPVLEQRFEALHFPDKAQLPTPLSRSNPNSITFPFRTNPRKS